MGQRIVTLGISQLQAGVISGNPQPRRKGWDEADGTHVLKVLE